MIEFSCSSCGRAFAVPDHFGGRRAKCKSCGAELTVPQAAPPPTPKRSWRDGPEPLTPPAEPKVPMRIRRLAADSEQMSKSFEKSELIKVQSTTGFPPDTYRIEYFVNSLERDEKGKPKPRSQHVVEIQLTSDYPRMSPSCKILTPIF